MIAMYEPCIFKGPDAAQTRRCRNARACRQINIGYSPVILKVSENPAVDCIQLYSLHKNILMSEHIL